MLQAVCLCWYFGDCPFWEVSGFDTASDDLRIPNEKLIALTEGTFSCVRFVVIRQLLPDCLELVLGVHQTGGQLAQNIHMSPVFFVVIYIHKVEASLAQALTADIGHPAAVLGIDEVVVLGATIFTKLLFPLAKKLQIVLCNCSNVVLGMSSTCNGGATFVFSPARCNEGAVQISIQFPVEPASGLPEVLRHQHLLGEHLIQTAEDVEGFVASKFLFPQAPGVVVLDGVLDVDADLGLDIRNGLRPFLFLRLVCPVQTAVMALQPGGDPDIALVIAQGNQDVVELPPTDQIIQLIRFGIQFHASEDHGAAKFWTLAEKSIQLLAYGKVTEGEFRGAAVEDTQGAGGPEEFPADLAEAQDQNVELSIVDVFIKGLRAQQIIAGGPEPVQEAKLRISEAAAGLQDLPQVPDEHGGGFGFGEEVQLLLELAVGQGDIAGGEEPLFSGGGEEILHPLEILIGVLRQEEEPQELPSAAGPEKEPGLVAGIEEEGDPLQLLQQVRVRLVPAGPQEDAQAVFAGEVFRHTDAVGIQIGEEEPFPLAHGDMVGQIVPQKLGSGEDRQCGDGAGEKLRNHGNYRQGGAELSTVALKNIKNGLDTGENPLPAATAEFGDAPQGQHQEQAERQGQHRNALPVPLFSLKSKEVDAKAA